MLEASFSSLPSLGTTSYKNVNSQTTYLDVIFIFVRPPDAIVLVSILVLCFILIFILAQAGNWLGFGYLFMRQVPRFFLRKHDSLLLEDRVAFAIPLVRDHLLLGKVRHRL